VGENERCVAFAGGRPKKAGYYCVVSVKDDIHQVQGGGGEALGAPQK